MQHIVLVALLQVFTGTPKEQQGADANLPSGALARLGTVSFRLDGPARQFSYTKDGKAIIYAHHNAVVSLDASTGLVQRRYTLLDNFIVSAYSITVDGTLLCVGSKKGGIGIIRVGQPAQITYWTGHADRIDALTISADGKALASRSIDGVLRIWDVPSGTFRILDDGVKRALGEMTFSPDGGTLFGADRTGLVSWDLKTKVEKGARKVLGGGVLEHGVVTAATTSLDGAMRASGHSDGNITLWSSAGVLRWGAHAVAVLSIAFSPDGSQVASGSGDGEVKVFAVPTRQELFRSSQRVSAVQRLEYSPDATYLAVSTVDPVITRINIPAKREENVDASQYSVFAARRRARDGCILTIDRAGQVLEWEGAGGTIKRCIMRVSEKLSAADISDDAERVLYRDGRWRLRLRELSSNHDVALSEVILEGPPLFAWSRGMDAIVFRDASRRIQIVDHAGVSKGRVDSDDDSTLSMAYSAESGSLITVGHPSVLRSWRIADGRQSDMYSEWGRGEIPCVVSVSLGGGLCAVGGSDGTVRVFTVSGLKSVSAWKRHSGKVRSLAFSGDGKAIVSGGDNGGVIVGKVAGGVEVARYDTGMVPVNYLDGSGDVVVAVLDNGVVLAYPWGLKGEGK